MGTPESTHTATQEPQPALFPTPDLSSLLENADQERPVYLKPFEAAFLAELQRNGHNHGKAYLTLRPSIKPSSARALACNLLKKPHIIKALEQIKHQSLKAGIVTKDLLLKDARRIAGKAEAKDQYNTALQGIELQAKLIDAFKSTESDAEAYTLFITSITNNAITINNSVAKMTQCKEVSQDAIAPEQADCTIIGQ